MFDTEKFIGEIEKRPAIYDVNRSEYNDRNAKMTAWDEVCQVMVPNWARLTDEERNVEEKNLRGKWRNIRDYFMKELKLQKSQKVGPVGRKRKKYMYFDQLLFLMPTVENKRNAGTTLNNCKSEESEGEIDNPVIEEYDVPLAHAAPSITTGREYLQPGASYKMCPRYPKQLCETSFASFDNEIHDILSSHSSQRVTYDEDDYDKMFLLSLLPIIRQVPEEKKLDVRIQMQQVLALALRPPDSMQ
ncbi:uncharacterized protein LOC117236794 [Bombus vosnesenskii]|uniref:Uncharacterized protein LOC117236794 n=2 Tax=Pyrobombus TaxID=144703 RepID=A0A6J3KSB4_9HYME|nr:uncharacterized protein LOC117155806 [Bombus vancouverensis nearcticus]XP_033302377.1 uncharacterized protein LOC117206816 [Bombus bifarius]XP_033355950.1 uncharacterized protein LOC117236794 [Bombus vosnesenskii]XP_050480764.1 uncharacterized protein LOC126868862 [Bombus huntii]